MPVKFNINRAMRNWQNSGGSSKFEKSLRQVLKYIQNDKNITNMAEAAYLLGTAKAESDYSLQRWESDYQCGKAGVPYVDYPCDRALNYYRSTRTGSGKSKRNYYEMGLDKNGMPYFGRGLIQLTGKHNYEKYGKLIGVDLISDGDRALNPWNSYRIASTYLDLKTFKHVNNGDLTRARKSVNGGTRGAQEVNDSYDLWLHVFEESGFRKSILTRSGRQFLILSTVTAALGFGYYVYAKKPTWGRGFNKKIDGLKRSLAKKVPAFA